MSNKNTKRESGQILVFVVLFIVGLFAMLALVLDGGNTYSKRRAAQNAADAGALAGARTLCITKDASQAIAVAQDYATNKNESDSADVVIDGEGYVTVTTRITFDTFFAHLIGRPRMTAEAVATSGCFPPTTALHILPIAWACHPPISEALSISDECQMQAIDEATLEYYQENPIPVPPPDPPPPIWPELYVIMNSDAQPDDLAAICQSAGGWLDCDLDDDGEDDLIANGDRSWLDLDGGGGGSSELIDWINNGFPTTIPRHTWLGGQPGVANNVFQAAGDHVGDIVLVPVFDQFCDNDPETTCPSKYHTGLDNTVVTAGGNYYYHIISFAGFYISCVNAPGVPGPECPGHAVAVDQGIIAHNVKTIEGYFVTDEVLEGLGGGDPNAIDLGIYTLKLYR